MHDATKVLMGATRSNHKDVTVETGDPATFVAGLMVRRASNGNLSLSSGQYAGVSLGRSLDGALDKTACLRTGRLVPVRLKNEAVLASVTIGDLTFTSKIPGAVDTEIELDDTGAAASASLAGDTIVVVMDDGVTTANAIKAAIEGNPDTNALVTVTVAPGEGTSPQAAAVATPLTGSQDAYGYVVIGEQVIADSSTGEAASTGTSTRAYYASGLLKGILIDGTEVDVALINLPGGLNV